MPSTLQDRLTIALAALTYPLSQSQIAAHLGISTTSVSLWFHDKTKYIKSQYLFPLARLLNVNAEWLALGTSPMYNDGRATLDALQFVKIDQQAGDVPLFPVPVLDARGSCGGGVITWDMEPQAPVMKSEAWFRRHDVRPEHCFGIWADGESMSTRIQHQDLLFFDKRVTEPRSGGIFLIDHPDGLRVKRLNRSLDGAWTLISDNPDKRLFPDERITPDQANLIRIHGRFVALES